MFELMSELTVSTSVLLVPMVELPDTARLPASVEVAVVEVAEKKGVSKKLDRARPLA